MKPKHYNVTATTGRISSHGGHNLHEHIIRDQMLYNVNWKRGSQRVSKSHKGRAIECKTILTLIRIVC